MTTQTEFDWLCESDVAHRSGLPGPLVEELIPRLPTPLGVDYNGAEVYDEDSVYRARLAVLMLSRGIRLRFVRLAMGNPMTLAELKQACQRWAAIPEKAQVPQQPTITQSARPPWQSAFLVTALLLCLAVGVIIGSLPH
jgi:hypothetical protein